MYCSLLRWCVSQLCHTSLGWFPFCCRCTYIYIYLCAVQCTVTAMLNWLFSNEYICVFYMCVYVSPNKQFNRAVLVHSQSLGLCTICNFKNVNVVLSRFYKHFPESVISTSHPTRNCTFFSDCSPGYIFVCHLFWIDVILILLKFQGLLTHFT